MAHRRTACWVVAAVFGVIVGSAISQAQDSRSASLAADVARQLTDRKLDSIAASLGGDEWVGALYLAGSQLLVVRGKYAGPNRLDALLNQRAYRELYVSLNSASDPSSKTLVSDVGANGLRVRRENNQPADRVDIGGVSYTFDGDPVRARLSEQEYSQTYRAADQRYAEMLQALLSELRKGV